MDLVFAVYVLMGNLKILIQINALVVVLKNTFKIHLQEHVLHALVTAKSALET